MRKYNCEILLILKCFMVNKCHFSKNVFLKVRSDCAFCNHYDCEDVFAHEIAYHTVHKWYDLLHDMLYSGIRGVPSKRSVYDISHT